jgi:hypothetical protein
VNGCHGMGLSGIGWMGWDGGLLLPMNQIPASKQNSVMLCCAAKITSTLETVPLFGSPIIPDSKPVNVSLVLRACSRALIFETEAPQVRRLKGLGGSVKSSRSIQDARLTLCLDTNFYSIRCLTARPSVYRQTYRRTTTVVQCTGEYLL